MTIRKEKRDQISKGITRRLLFVNAIDEIVINMYDSISNSLDQISTDSHDDYRQYLLRTLLSNVLFNEVLVSSEGQLVYRILMDFLRLAGFSLNRNILAESDSEDGLFGIAFKRSSNHRMENSLSYEPSFFEQQR